MTVNGGSGNQISFSELQSYYGGSRPIALSDYYRGGGEVPTTKTAVAAHSSSGSGSGTAGGVTVTVSTSGTVSRSLRGTTYTEAGGISVTAPNLPGIVFVSVDHGANNGNDDSTARSTLRRNNTVVQSVKAGSGSGSGGTYTGAIAAGDVFEVRGGDQSRSISINYTLPASQIVFSNNSGHNLALTSASTGGSRTLNNDAQATVQSGSATQNQAWTVGYNAVSGPANTNVPYEKTVPEGVDASTIDNNPINMNVFNDPGAPSR